MITLQKLCRLYNGMLFVNLIMAVLIILLYPASFSLLMDPVSWLGKIGPGITSRYGSTFFLFSATMFFNAFCWKKIISLLATTPIWKKPIVHITGHLILIGFILMLFPCDRFDAIHSSGGGLAAGGLWVLSTMLLYRSRNILNPYLYGALLFLLQTAALYCIFNFAINSALKGFGQRPVILALMIIPNVCLAAHIRNQKNQRNGNDIPELFKTK